MPGGPARMVCSGNNNGGRCSSNHVCDSP
jgi:hypothetical protein